MHRLHMSMVATLILFTTLLGGTSTVLADDASEQLDQAMSQLDSWLAKYDQGPGWHRYLRNEELRLEIAKGDTADHQKVGEILTLYNSGVDGLEDQHFVDVQAALARWHGDVLLPPAADLPALAKSASEQFTEMTPEDVAQAKQNLQAASRRLGSWLDRHGENGQAWKSYLNFSDLETELATDEPDLVKLESVVRQFASDKDGLEMPKYLDVWKTLRKYIDTHQVAKYPQVKEQYQQQAVVLAKLLAELPEKSTFRERELIGQRLGYFERMGQSASLVRAIRGHHSHPNFSGYVVEDVLAAAINRRVDEKKEGLTDNIMGTSLVIDAETDAKVKADVVPNEQRAAFNIMLEGEIKTDAVGYNRGVTIWSVGSSAVEASKAFFIDENGISAEPATAVADTRTTVTGLSAKRRIIERIAWRKVGEQKGTAERIGARKTARRVSAQMDAEAGTMLGDSQQKFDDGFRHPLVRRRAFPEVLEFSSTDKALKLTMLQATSKQLGAPAPIEPLAVENDLGIRLHESLINNFASTLYSGRTLTSHEVKTESQNSPLMKRFKEKQEAKRKARGEAAPDEEVVEEDWAITFAKRYPVTVEFNDGLVRLTIRGTRFEGEGPVQERDMSIWAVYKFELTEAEGLKLALQEWDVVPTTVETGGRIKAADEPLRQKLKARFEKIFVDVELDPLELPGQFAKAGLFGYKQVSAVEGWFTLGLDQIPGTGNADDRVAKSTPAGEETDESQKQ